VHGEGIRAVGSQGKTFMPMHLVLRRVVASLKEGKRWRA